MPGSMPTERSSAGMGGSSDWLNTRLTSSRRRVRMIPVIPSWVSVGSPLSGLSLM